MFFVIDLRIIKVISRGIDQYVKSSNNVYVGFGGLFDVTIGHFKPKNLQPNFAYLST